MGLLQCLHVPQCRIPQCRSGRYCPSTLGFAFPHRPNCPQPVKIPSSASSSLSSSALSDRPVDHMPVPTHHLHSTTVSILNVSCCKMFLGDCLRIRVQTVRQNSGSILCACAEVWPFVCCIPEPFFSCETEIQVAQLQISIMKILTKLQS